MSDSARHPAGIPVGGQFAPTSRSEGDVTLDEGQAAKWHPDDSRQDHDEPRWRRYMAPEGSVSIVCVQWFDYPGYNGAFLPGYWDDDPNHNGDRDAHYNRPGEWITVGNDPNDERRFMVTSHSTIDPDAEPFVCFTSKRAPTGEDETLDVAAVHEMIDMARLSEPLVTAERALKETQAWLDEAREEAKWGHLGSLARRAGIPASAIAEADEIGWGDQAGHRVIETFHRERGIQSAVIRPETYTDADRELFDRLGTGRERSVYMRRP